MTTGASDAELVRAHVAGDRAALAAIYDRYAPSLFDTATALLGDRDEAADVVQDTFLAAHQHLARLRDPSRLRAWLFAVARHEVERRGRKRRRAVPTATVAEMAPSVTPDLGADVQGTELAAMVRAAAAGLDERDQLVLELSMRQGLEGADLAAVLGVTPAQSYTLVFRMRERVSRALRRAGGGPDRTAGLRRAGRDPPGLGRHLLRAGPQARGAPRRALRHL